jgi:predicted enzyme related to lactoylglutathione lyase
VLARDPAIQPSIDLTQETVMTTTTLAAITFDCADAKSLAEFWSAVLARPVDDGADADYATIPGDPMLAFTTVPEPKQAKNRVHVDLVAEDLEAEVDRVIALGARRLGDFDESGERWTTLADPEGNEFDIAAAH